MPPAAECAKKKIDNRAGVDPQLQAGDVARFVGGEENRSDADVDRLDIWYFFCQAEDGIRDFHVTGVQTCALPICRTVAADSLIAATYLAGTNTRRVRR